MISALLLSLAFGQLLPKDPPIRPRVFRSDGAGRISRLGSDDFAFFEAFPSNGAGAGAVAPYPNWILQSEAFDNAAWTKLGTGASAAPTVTANAGVAPDGTNTAERVQFPSTLAGDRSIVYQSISSVALGGNFAIWVKGYGGTSGVLDVWHDNTVGGTGCGCAYNGTTWTRCFTVTPLTVASSAAGFGNESFAAHCPVTARSAQDVLVWGGDFYLNALSTPPAYVATTTAAMGFAPTGAKGEALTFTRASTAYATRTAAGGLSTTGIVDGDLVLMPANQPRVEYDSAGTLGLLVESSRTNVCLRSQELDNAAWSAISGGGPALPVVTANAAVAPDGTTTAERVDFPAVGAVGYSLVRQTGVGSVGSASTRTLYAKAVGSACSFYFADASSGGESVLCPAVTTSWTRCSVNVSAANVLGYFDIGTNRNVTSETATSACSVYLWGAQAETTTAAYATSYIPTGAGTATRAAELASFPLVPTSVATGSMSAQVQLPRAAVNGFLSATSAGAFKQAIITFSGERAYVGGVSLVGPLAALSAGQHAVGMWWDGTSTNLVLDGTTTSGAAGTPAATDRLQIGNYDSTAASLEDGIYSRIKYDLTTTKGL